MSPELVESMRREIQETLTASGDTIHFAAENPLPTDLVRDILAARLDESEADE